MKSRFTPRFTGYLLTLLALSASGMASAKTQINALFMSQAAYSESDVRAMTSDFEKANPDVSVNLEFVPYEALHDKIVAARGAGSNGYDVVLFDTRGIAAVEKVRTDLTNLFTQ